MDLQRLWLLLAARFSAEGGRLQFNCARVELLPRTIIDSSTGSTSIGRMPEVGGVFARLRLGPMGIAVFLGRSRIWIRVPIPNGEAEGFVRAAGSHGIGRSSRERYPLDF